MKEQKQKNEIVTINTIKDFIKQIQNIHTFFIDYKLLRIFIRIIRYLYRYLNTEETFYFGNLKKIENFYNSLKNTNRKEFIKSIKDIDNKLKDYEIENLYKYFNKKVDNNKTKVLDIFVDNILYKEIYPTFSIMKKNEILYKLNNMTYLEKIKFLISKISDNKELHWLKTQLLFVEIIIYLHDYLINIGKYESFDELKEKIRDLKKQKNLEELNILINNIEEIYNSLKEEYNFEIVFRAPSKNNKNLIRIEDEKTSLFKNKNLIGNERLIYKDFIASNPNEFENMTTFDILTKMRHYEVPNRLLDVTSDPLLALFFACGQKNDGSKTVFLYLVKEKNIKYYDSDTVTVLSVLSKLRKKDKKNLKYIVDIFSKNKKSEIYKNFNLYIIKHKGDFNVSNLEEMLNKEKFSIEDMIKLEFLFENYLIDSKNKHLDMKIISPKQKSFLIEKFVNNYRYGYEEYLKKVTFDLDEIFNIFISTFVPELNWQLKNEIPSWYNDALKLDTFTQCYLVKPKMNNPRIIAQSGAFFIYPFENTDINIALFDGYIFKIGDTRAIKEELDLLNIKETKYIPDDLAKYAKEIREKYS